MEAKTLERLIKKSNEAKKAFSKVNINFSENILVKIYGSSIEIVTCEDSTLSERIFGGSVDVYGNLEWGSKERTIKLNVGSMGSFDDTCVASVSKVKIQSSILSNWDGFVTVSTLLMDQVENGNQLKWLMES